MLFFQTANSETPKSGGDYTEALIGTIESINPLYASTNPADLDISKLIFSGLTRFDLQQQRMVLDIADTIEVSEDRKTYTFTIQEDIQWHDEQPFSVDDILFTYRDVLQSPEYTGPYKGLWKNIVIEKIDNKTIRFQLNTPDIFFLRNTSIGILPKHILEYADINNLKFHKYSENPIGTGPYKIQRHLNNTVKLVRFEESYHEGNYLDSITLKVYDNYKDIINNQKSFNSIKQIPSEYLSTIDTSHFDIQEFTLPQYTALFFNTKNEYLKNPYLRNLFVEGLSKTDLLSDIEHIQEANSPVFINNESASSDIHIPAGETIRKYFERFGFRDIEETEVDTSLAHSPAQYLYKEVSFQGDLFEKKLLFQLACLNTQEHLSIAYKIKNTLEKWGVDIQVQEYSNKEIIDIITERDYDLLIFGQNLGTDLDLYPIWHSSQTE
ncbi:MAG: ABC transporter substrate-binding protein [Patescibacteria group bacterium]|nr:ABC transporter substrate-binding protein [Patescibacteria group bacterium]